MITAQVAGSLIAFTAAAGVLTITPGVDTFLVLRSAARRGTRSGAAAAAGITLGLLIWGCAAAFGLTALLAASAAAFTVLKWAGAAYLAFLGARLLLSGGGSTAVKMPSAAASEDPGAPFRKGLFTNLLNPKIGVFYLTFLPQFIPPGANVAAFSLTLAGIHMVLGALWFAVLIALTAPLGRWLAAPKVVRTLDVVTGGVFLAFGVRLALEERS